MIRQVSPRKTVEQLVAEARARFDRVTPAEAAAAMAAGAILIDTRSSDVRGRDGTVPGSHHVPLSVLPWRVDPASPYRNPDVARPDARVILLCAEGYSSSLAAAWLKDLGFARVADLEGGFEAWRAAGLPVEPVTPVEGDG